MIKRPFRSLKVPLVYGGQWKNHQTFQKWDPVSKRLVQVGCCLPTYCPVPVNTGSVTLSDLTGTGATISWVYDGPDNTFEINIYEGSSLPVNTSEFPIFNIEGTLLSPYTASFTATNNYYYVASVRVRNDCGYSDYVYSGPFQYVACSAPDPVDSVTLSNLTATGGDFSFVYGGSETQFWAEIYESATLPVDTSGSSIFNLVGALPSGGNTYIFPTTLNYYYVVGLRVRKDCGGGNFVQSTYVYSNTVQYI